MGAESDSRMIPRADLIRAVKAAETGQSFSAAELSQLIGVPTGTLNGWLSDKRAFPPAEIGARRRRIYNGDALKRLAVYQIATTNGLGMGAHDIRLLISRIDVEEAWKYYLDGVAEFISHMIEKRDEILGGTDE